MWEYSYQDRICVFKIVSWRGCYQCSTLVMGAGTVYEASSSLETNILCTTNLLLSLSTVLKHSFESNARSSDGQGYQNG